MFAAALLESPGTRGENGRRGSDRGSAKKQLARAPAVRHGDDGTEDDLAEALKAPPLPATSAPFRARRPPCPRRGRRAGVGRALFRKRGAYCVSGARAEPRTASPLRAAAAPGPPGAEPRAPLGPQAMVAFRTSSSAAGAADAAPSPARPHRDAALAPTPPSSNPPAPPPPRRPLGEQDALGAAPALSPRARRDVLPQSPPRRMLSASDVQARYALSPSLRFAAAAAAAAAARGD